MTDQPKVMKKGNWTMRYAMINALYFAAFCGVHEYASLYLLAQNFTNAQIGLILAIANITSVVAQPVVASAIDRPGRLTNRNVSMFCTGMMLLGSAVLYITRSSMAVIFVTYVMIYMIQMLYQPMIIAMSFEYRQHGIPVNFGLARGIGSVGFAVYSMLMGNVLKHFGVKSLQVADILVLIVMLLFLVSFRLPAGDNTKIPEKMDQETTGEKESIGLFLHRYRRFMVFLAATICFFFAHCMSNDFLIQIITPLGGNATDLGYVVSIAAVLELPTMAGFMKLSEKIDCGILLKLSGLFFLAKVILLFFARDMAGIYISYVLQIGSYAMFIPGSAFYVHRVMQERDQVKGQALVNCAITLGGVFSNLVCGYVLDYGSVKMMVGIGVCICAVGALISMFAIQRVGLQEENA